MEALFPILKRHHYQLITAIHRGHFARAKLLIDNGVDVNKPDDTYDTVTKGKTPWETAMLLGARKIADYLVKNGALATELGRLDGLHASCMGADLASARELILADPALRDDIEARRAEMLNDAALTNNWPALETMIALGLDFNVPGERTPLHVAALEGNLDLVKKLIEAGADPKLRDREFHSPPLGFALHAGKIDVIDFLDTVEADVFTAASRGRLDQLINRLTEDRSRLEQRFSEVQIGSHNQFGTGWFTPLASAVGNNRVDVVRWLLSQEADPSVNDGKDRSVLSLAKDHAGPEILELIETALGKR